MVISISPLRLTMANTATACVCRVDDPVPFGAGSILFIYKVIEDDLGSFWPEEVFESEQECLAETDVELN